MMLSSTHRRSEKILSAAAIYRGDVENGEIEETTFRLQSKEPYRFADYLSNSISTSVCAVPSLDVPLSATCVINSSCVSDKIRHALDAATSLYSNQAYLHYYENSVTDADCIKNSIQCMESVYKDYINLEYLAPSDEPNRKPRISLDQSSPQIARQYTNSSQGYNDNTKENKAVLYALKDGGTTKSVSSVDRYSH